MLEAYLAGSGLEYGLWVMTYIVLIKVAIRDKRVGYPVVFTILSLAWEFLYSFVFRYPQGLWVNALNATWLVPDIAIFVLIWKYERKRFLPQPWANWGGLGLCLVLGWGLGFFTFFRSEFGDVTGTQVSFLLNLLGSGLYLKMLFSRRGATGSWDLSGLSKWVTWGKFLGTLITAMLVTWYFPTWHAKPSLGLAQMVYVGIFVLDVLAILLHHQMASKKQVG